MHGRHLLLCLCSMILCSSPASARQEAELASRAKAAILLDAATGKVLYEKNADEELPPASVTKVMTMLLLMEAVKDGRVNLTDKVQVSDHAASMGGSQIFLQSGETMSVEDLLKGVAVASANDASVALAEFLAGTEEAFVARMNAKAEELGLAHTHFENPNGLPGEQHYSSARDLALVSKELLQHDQITKYTGLYEDYLRTDSANPFWLVNTNKLVKFYAGMDGLKTGFTDEAKYCLAATAKRDEMRVITVVLGEPDVKIRSQETTNMLDYAFNQYTNHCLYNAGELIAEAKLIEAEHENLKIIADKPYYLLVRKGFDPSKLERRVIWEQLTAPIEKGDLLGRIEIVDGEEILAELRLHSNVDFARAGWWGFNKRFFRQLFGVQTAS